MCSDLRGDLRESFLAIVASWNLQYVERLKIIAGRKMHAISICDMYICTEVPSKVFVHLPR